MGRVRFVRPLVRRVAALGTFPSSSACLAAVLGGGPGARGHPGHHGGAARRVHKRHAHPGERGGVDDDRLPGHRRLCAGKKPAGNRFSLVTGKPNSVTGAAAPQYPDGPLSCGSAAATAVTEVKLTFTPSPALSAVPQTAALVVTPPQSLLLAGNPPLQVPLTVRRIVSPWQYAGIPAVCGGALAVLLVLVLMLIGVPGEGDGRLVAPRSGKPCRLDDMCRSLSAAGSTSASFSSCS